MSKVVVDGDLTKVERIKGSTQIYVDVDGTDQLALKDGSVEPVTDNDVDLGATGKRVKNAYIAGSLDDDTKSLTVANAKDAYDHVSADGSDHTFIDQDVTSGSAPTFTGTNFSGIPASALPDADDDSSTKGVCTFDNADFNAASGVVTIEDSGVDHDATTNFLAAEHYQPVDANVIISQQVFS